MKASLASTIGVPIKQIDPDDTERHVRPHTKAERTLLLVAASRKLLSAFAMYARGNGITTFDSRFDDDSSEQGDNDMRELLDALESSGMHGLITTKDAKCTSGAVGSL